MDQNLELVEYIYQNSNMGVYAITKLINNIKGKDNKIIKLVEEQLKGYEKFVKECEKIIKKNKLEVKDIGLMPKMMTNMEVKFKVMEDNSDAAISKMLTQGITMGIVEIETKIKNYKDCVKDNVLDLAKDYLKFCENQIKQLKEYL